MTFENDSRFYKYPDVKEDVIGNVFLPFSNLKCGILDTDGIYRDICENSPIYRLSRVKQLSNLAYVGPDPERQYLSPTEHDRYDHTMTVAVVTEFIMRNNGFNEEEVTKGIAASLLHDIATPAHGDPTMRIDPENLAEEENLTKALTPATVQILEKYGISLDEIELIVKNEGVLGKILDISDRITYVMKDLHSVGFNGKVENRNRYNKEISRILHQFPNIGNIYKDVTVNHESGEVYFENAERLEAFLMLRGLLSSKLYFHPVSQGRDLIYEMMLKRIYSPVTGENKLDPTSLRAMSDYELDMIIFNEYGNLFRLDYESEGSDFTFQQALSNFYTRTVKHPIRKIAEVDAEIMQHSDEFSILGIVENKGFKTGTNYLVKDGKGKIVPFYICNPQANDEIQAMSNSVKGCYVHYLLREEKPREAEFVDFLKS